MPLGVAVSGETRRSLLHFKSDSCPIQGQQASLVLFVQRNRFLRTVLCWHLRQGLHPVTPALLQITYYSCIFIYKPRPIPGLMLVDPVGFEPTTFSMPLRRAPNCAMGPCVPTLKDSTIIDLSVNDQVDLAGFEPATSSVRLTRAPNCATGPLGKFHDFIGGPHHCQETAFRYRCKRYNAKEDIISKSDI